MTSPIDFPWACEMCFEAEEVPLFLCCHVVQIESRDCTVGKRKDSHVVMKSGPGPATMWLTVWGWRAHDLDVYSSLVITAYRQRMRAKRGNVRPLQQAWQMTAMSGFHESPPAWKVNVLLNLKWKPEMKNTLACLTNACPQCPNSLCIQCT